MNTLPNIVAAILVALTVNLGTFDLSGVDQVQEGTWEAPPGSVAFACLPPAELISSVGECRNAYYLETWRQTVRLWAPSTSSGTEVRASTSRQLAAQAQQVLDNARANGASACWRVVRWEITGARVNPSAATANSTWAYAELVITFAFRRATGTGA
jgi:hypothetical protein